MATTSARAARDVTRSGEDDDLSIWERSSASSASSVNRSDTTEVSTDDETAAPGDGAAAPAAAEAPAPAADTSWRRHRWSLAAGVLVLALLAGVVVAGIQWLDRRTLDASREEASASARETATSLTSLDFNTVDADVKHVIDLTTGDFRNQFTQNAEPFSNVIRTAKVETTSEVVASGVQSVEDTRARVLVAVRSTVKNIQSPEPQVRNYRMAIDLQREGDRWLADNVEFVP